MKAGQAEDDAGQAQLDGGKAQLDLAQAQLDAAKQRLEERQPRKVGRSRVSGAQLDVQVQALAEAGHVGCVAWAEIDLRLLATGERCGAR